MGFFSLVMLREEQALNMEGKKKAEIPMSWQMTLVIKFQHMQTGLPAECSPAVDREVNSYVFSLIPFSSKRIT